jgi:parvulin-like peptidyl-prolyl isomerase
MRESIRRTGILFMLLACGETDAAEPATPASPPRIAAVVNGETISLDEVDAIVRNRRGAIGPLTTDQVRQLRTTVTEDLVDDLLLRQFLRQQAPKVDSAEIEKHMRSLSQALNRQGRTVAEFLKQTGQTEQQIRETWATLYRFEKFMETRATEEELKKYHASHLEQFDGTEVRTSHIVLRVSPNAPSGERVAARQKLANLRDQITSGKLSFADAARKYSICPSARMGGDLGPISRRDTIVDEAIAQSAFTLERGAISMPIDTDYGVHLVMAVERIAGSNPPFSQVSELVRDAYTEDVRRQLINHARKLSKIQLSIP